MRAQQKQGAQSKAATIIWTNKLLVRRAMMEWVRQRATNERDWNRLLWGDKKLNGGGGGGEGRTKAGRRELRGRFWVTRRSGAVGVLPRGD